MSILQEILFYLYTALILFIPGYLLLLAIFKKNTPKHFSPLEIFTISFSISLVCINFLIIILNTLGFPIDKTYLIISITIFAIACISWYLYKTKKENSPKTKSNYPIFSKNQSILIILIIVFTIFLKTSYLENSVFPTSTDLGHHMYWSKLISQTGELPNYEEFEIIEKNSTYVLEKEDIADFIIGEHLIFSAMNILTGASFFSAFPALILFLINIISILAIFILSLRVLSNSFFKNISKKISNVKDPKNIAILSLFIIGPLYALASPQAKFLSGGVIGNVIGNLLIPTSLYFYFRALREKNSGMMFLAILISAGLFFFHHLSALIFIIIFISIFITLELLFISNIINLNRKKKIRSLLSSHLKVFKKYLLKLLSFPNILLLIFILFFTFFIYTPSYLNFEATSTAVGEPSKATRTGLTLSQFKYAVGEPRLALGIIGIAFLFLASFFRKENKKRVVFKNIITPALLIGWGLAVAIMSTKPHWIYINIPSGRVANYANFPFVILSSLGIIWIMYFIQNTYTKGKFLSKKILLAFFILIFTTLISAGYFDNSEAMDDGGNIQEALETFHASKYLSNQVDTTKDIILKDHNYIKADAWMKLFFMEDYGYPLSRGFFKRYEDPTKPREMCTLWMIASPSSSNATTCFQGTRTNFIMVNPSSDSMQFEKNDNFWKIYSGKETETFYKY